MIEKFNLDIRTQLQPQVGRLLIAEPFMTDNNFSRSVIFLCEHNKKEGSVGFVLNKVIESNIGNLLPELATISLQVYFGGPIQTNELHVVHQLPEYLGGIEIVGGVYWGTSYEKLSKLISNQRHNDLSTIKVFLGTSSWSPGQLEEEIDKGAWLVADYFDDILFNTTKHCIWDASIRSLGSHFKHFANLPIHPTLN